MNQIGWEIRPLGWLLLLVLAGFLVYRLFKWRQPPPAEPNASPPLSPQ